MTNVVGYIRVSSDGQATDGQSLDIQKDDIENYCSRNGLNLLYVFEDVQSGESAEKRKGLQAALKMLETDSVSALVVHKQDRFTRSVYDAEAIKRQLKTMGKRLIFTTDQLDLSSDDGEMMYQFKAVFAEYERKQIYRRCRAGYERKRAQGGYASGHPPFGYDAIDGELVKNEAELKVFRIIDEMRSYNYLYRTIAEYLNALGSRTKRGCEWTSGSVRGLYARRPNIKLNLPA
jgi:site-specific DNA recombinase